MIKTKLTHLALRFQTTAKFIHYAYPPFICLYFFVALTVCACTRPPKREKVKEDRPRKKFMLCWVFGIILTYFAESILYAVRGVATGLYSDRDQIVCSIASTMAYGLQALVLIESQYPVWYPYLATWIISFTVELTLLFIHLTCHSTVTPYDLVIIVNRVTRVFCFIILLYSHVCYQKYHKRFSHVDAERQSLLSNDVTQKSLNSEGYYGDNFGTNPGNSRQENNGKSDTNSEDRSQSEHNEDVTKLGIYSKQSGNWFEYVKGFAIIFPYLWPFKDRTLQLRAFLVFICLLGSSALNVLVPRQMGTMVDSLTKYVQGDYSHNIWSSSIIYILLRFASGGSGISWFRQWLWNPIEQYSYDALTTASHSHIMNLSSDFHDSKTSSDLSQAVLGGRSVTLLLETIFFQIVPMSLDLALAFGYLASQFGPYMGLLLLITVALYFYATTKLYAHRAKKRRNFITMFRKEINIGQESLDGWTTASLFNMIFYEQRRYACAVKEHLQSKYTYEISSQLVNVSQGIIMAVGLLGILWLGIYQVVYENKSVGQFTTLLIFWAQLSTPLVFFSTIYRSLMNSMMDAERLLELLKTKPTIANLPNAKPLELKGGLVKFDRVSFAYDPRKPTLKSISLTARPGKTIALVGETGGGKSTILKLLDRFYDVTTGSILIDGQDIRSITLSSLRQTIGVVPQDPMLFNDTIINNVRYAKMSASNEEVFEACKAAAIHDKILNFPDGYNSKVGDRGMKLSGGEKQRIAIARVILKRPDIIILDEATSAVDTETEHSIQEGLNSLCQGRTTFIVAHRLSTIMNADYIYVIMDGEIVEEGSHSNLIIKKGKYQQLWSKQLYKKAPVDSPNSRKSSLESPSPITINTLFNSKQDKRIACKYSKSSSEFLNKNESESNRTGYDSKRQETDLSEGPSETSNKIYSLTEDASSCYFTPSSDVTDTGYRGKKTRTGISSLRTYSSKIAVRQTPNVKVEQGSKLPNLVCGETMRRRSLAKTDPQARISQNFHDIPCQSGDRVPNLKKSHPSLLNIKSIRRHLSNPNVSHYDHEVITSRNRRNRQLKLKNRGLDKLLPGASSQIGTDNPSVSGADNSKASVVEERRSVQNRYCYQCVAKNDKNLR